jgi:hypothetical protein
MEDPAAIEALIQKAQVFMRESGGPADFDCAPGDDLARAAVTGAWRAPAGAVDGYGRRTRARVRSACAAAVGRLCLNANVASKGSPSRTYRHRFLQP